MRSRDVLGLDPAKIDWQAPGLNHNIWLTHFLHEGKDAYPLLEAWIATNGEEYWRTHVAERTHDIQMSRGTIHMYRMFGLMPIGDTPRQRRNWWYHTDIWPPRSIGSASRGAGRTPSWRGHTSSKISRSASPR